MVIKTQTQLAEVVHQEPQIVDYVATSLSLIVGLSNERLLPDIIPAVQLFVAYTKPYIQGLWETL